MFGLGKSRTKFGKWLDKKGISQNDVAKGSKVGRSTISRMAGDRDYSPKYSTFVKVKKWLKKEGYSKDYDDFWC
nr:helix-turn-helix transcriptional regulator [Sporolactobacillus terrae]